MNGSARFEAVAILSVAFLTASLSACGAPKAKPKDPASETATNIRLAESYFHAGRVNEALDILQKAAASQPAPGSVRAKAPIFSPRASGRRYFCFWSSLPNFSMPAQTSEFCTAKMMAVEAHALASSSMAIT